MNTTFNFVAIRTNPCRTAGCITAFSNNDTASPSSMNALGANADDGPLVTTDATTTYPKTRSINDSSNMPHYIEPTQYSPQHSMRGSKSATAESSIAASSHTAPSPSSRSSSRFGMQRGTTARTGSEAGWPGGQESLLRRNCGG